MTVPLHRQYGDHRGHAECFLRGTCGVCVPAFLHAEFVQKSGFSEEDEADRYVRAFYQAVNLAWTGKAIGDDNLGFWRARWKEHVGSTVNARHDYLDALRGTLRREGGR